MNTQEQIEQTIVRHRPGGENSCAYVLFQSILNKYKPGMINNLTFQELKNLVPDFDFSEVYDTLVYFDRSGLDILHQEYFLLDEYSNRVSLSNQDVASALKGGTLYNPDTGEEVIDPEKEVFFRYVGTDALKKLLKEQENGE